MAGPHALVHDRDVLPEGTRSLDGLHLLVAARHVGRLHVGAEDVFHAVVVPALRFDGGHDASLELRQRLAVFQRFLDAVAHQLHEVVLRQPRDVERPVHGLLPQRLGLRVRQLGPLLPELNGGVRRHGGGDDLPRRKLNDEGLFRHRPPPRR